MSECLQASDANYTGIRLHCRTPQVAVGNKASSSIPNLMLKGK